MSYRDKILQKLKDRHADNSFRTLIVREGLVDFFSNDYLGFARDQELFNAVLNKEAQYRLEVCNGSTGSRLLSGNTRLAEEAETCLAAFFQAEKTLIFNSGYSANVGVLSALPQKGDTILYDELIHASLKDGARLSFADRISFKHNDLEDFEKKIKRAKGDIFVVVESIYSMDGDKAPLKEIIRIAKQYDACIIVDEAHSTGTCGAYGEGFVLAEGLQDDVDIRIHTFGKAMGIHGACVAGEKMVIDYLINFSRAFIYTTAFSPHSFFAVLAAFEKLRGAQNILTTLHKNIQQFSAGLKQFDSYIVSTSSIQVLKIGGNDRVKELAQKIQAQGFDVRPILSPTVKKGEERLRFCIHAFNTETQLTDLLACIKKNL
ncbi:MAG: aminotransferase class I/II-fold pyridoxal phosphate-dependent enzyme [Cytophaga sp.]|uniref:aminotransferase class I/II-fold pyridoxal phosphate-dependent enzyme n=1 Tax=Cytophaga sp. TaxID=29535 RepID=UPI003F81465C